MLCRTIRVASVSPVLIMAILSETTPLEAQTSERVNAFLLRWEKAKGKERSNYQMFFAELADALGVERPNPQGSTIAYEFDYSMDPQKTPAMIRIYTVSLSFLLLTGEAQFYVQ